MSPVLLGSIAAAIVVGAGVGWFRAIHQVRIPKDRRGYLAVWLLGGALGIAALVSGAGWPGGIPAGIAILGTAFFLLTVPISRQQAAPDVIAVGASIRNSARPTTMTRSSSRRALLGTRPS